MTSESRREKSKDRRVHSRFAVRNTLRFRNAASAPPAPWEYGRSLDMAAGGMLIETPVTLPMGTKLEISMEWIGLYHNRENMRLQMIAAVTRVDDRGMAVRILRHKFREVPAVAGRARRAVA